MRFRLLRFPLRLALFAVVGLGVSNGYAHDSSRHGPVPGRFVVKLSSKANSQSMQLAVSGGARLERMSQPGARPVLAGSEAISRFFVYATPDTTISAAQVASYLGTANVEYVEPDYYVEFFGWPQDALFSNQWYLHNSGQDYYGIERNEGDNNDRMVMKHGTAGVDVKAGFFYDTPPAETTSVVVAIIDTGIDFLHPELAGRIWSNPDETPDNGIDDDHNGYVDDVHGFDVSGDSLTIIDIIPDNDPSDETGHGTHLAGIVAANADDAGVIGVAPWAKIMPVKIYPNAMASVGAAGIIYAVSSGARVINVSWGSPYDSRLIQEAMEFARSNGVFVAVAAGNSGNAQRFYPASFDSVFAVAAGASDGYLTYFSTYGPQIDVVAPGQDMLSLRARGTDMYASSGEPGNRIVDADSLYYLADGTSMAAPVVAGGAAMLWSFRPDLGLAQLEQILRLGADDMLDPLHEGDSLAGPDTLSGYGYLNLRSSYLLVTQGGLSFVEPVRCSRYAGDVRVKVAPVLGYSGSWTLEYAGGLGSSDWHSLASGTSLPADSVIYVFDNGPIEGQLCLRLTDKYGRSRATSFTYVRQRRVTISDPQTGQQLKYNAGIHGSVYGPDYDSMAIYCRQSGKYLRRLFSSTTEFFDSLMYIWTASDADTGAFEFYLHGYFRGDDLADTVLVTVLSSFTAGWPRQTKTTPSLTPVCADLNRDGRRELVVPTGTGLYLFKSDGNLVPGFPVMPLVDMRCVPAIYDLDRDGQDEIICTNDSGIYAFKYDGSQAEGWPQYCVTGAIPYGYGYPNPAVVRVSYRDMVDGQSVLVVDSAVMIINKVGHILAFTFEGRSFFASLGGLFAYFDARASDIFRSGGETSPFVSGADFDGDGASEVAACYTGAFPYTGTAVFQGKNGQPAYHAYDPMVTRIASVFGCTMGDLNADGRPEIIAAGTSSDDVASIWALTNGKDVMPGFPVTMPDVHDWVASYPVLADLDLDGTPEILITFFEFDISALYIFRADGSPYITVEGRPSGKALSQPVTFGTPTVANITGDKYPEIIIRSGYIWPGHGPEQLFVLDNQANVLPGWPIMTPSRWNLVFSSRYAPLVDDLDGDGKVEVILAGDGLDVLVWDFDASYENGKNTGRFLYDNLNSGYYGRPFVPTDVDDYVVILPRTVNLYQNFPNPFNPSTTITFDLPGRSRVLLEVFNILGQRVSTLLNRDLSAGKHRVDFDGQDCASGVYFYRLSAGETFTSKKMLLVK
jgi:hypothetical protein